MTFLKKIIISFVFTIFVSNNANANDLLKAKDFINNFGNKVIQIASDDSITLEIRKTQLIELIESKIDAKWIARFVLARNYRTASTQQRIRFEDLYRQFMIHSYGPSFSGYNGEDFEIIDVMQKGKYFMIKCFFVPSEGPKINVAFRLKKNQEQTDFVILDVMVEGVGLIETQRSEFNSVISQKGLAGFLDDLEIRVNELKIANNS